MRELRIKKRLLKWNEPMRISLQICFFFSSRRRHTRCLSDWSSDVCSSDLRTSRYQRHSYGTPFVPIPTLVLARLALRKVERSEERRVGKECRSRWSPYH